MSFNLYYDKMILPGVSRPICTIWVGPHAYAELYGGLVFVTRYGIALAIGSCRVGAVLHDEGQR